MNIYEKLQKMRVDLQNMNLKKSGENKFAGYKYYELGDILPPINKLMLENKVASVVTFGDEQAVLRLVNCEDTSEAISFVSPMAGATLKGAHDIQNLGAVETYQRRYLYMTAFEVVESDFFDATQGKPEKPQRPEPKKKLSEDMSKMLNDAVSGYASIAGMTNKQVVEKIKQATGKTPATMTNEDGERVLDLIGEWHEETLRELGV